MKKFRMFFQYILGFPKTVIFNLRYLPIKDAIRLPIIVSHRVWLMNLSGKVKIRNVRTGMIRIGFGEVSIFDQHRSRTIWNVSGTIEFKGNAKIGHGSKISVDGDLVIGKNLMISAESSIVSKNRVIIGDDVLISWDALIMDSDFHNIYNENGDIINPPRPVIIGNKVWIGCRSLILKGTNIAEGVVVAASSTVTKSINNHNSIYGGYPIEMIKENISW